MSSIEGTKAVVKPVLIIAGPTASGKSSLAVDVAEAFSGVVINADSMQVYRHLSLLNAKPSSEDMARVPHRLYGVFSPEDICSAGRWLSMAIDEISAAWEDNHLPIVVGGTGLYIKALVYGLADVPDIPDEARKQVRKLYQDLGEDGFRKKLSGLDAVAAAKISPGDGQRLIRAYEVVSATGETLDVWQGRQENAAPLPASFAMIALSPPRDELYVRINDRFEQMVANGAIEEAAAMQKLGLDPQCPVMKAVGVRELGRYLAKEISLDEAKDAAKQASRNLAKRQMTWLRHQEPRPDLTLAQYSESFRDEIFSFIRPFVLTGRV
jgi:tRNA dimethylallyltransferase